MPELKKYGNFTFEGDYEDLREHAQWIYGQMEAPCNNRKKIIDELCGANYSDGGGTPDQRALPFIEMYMSVFVRANFSHEPAAMVTSDKQELKVTANMLQMASPLVLRNASAAHVWSNAVSEAMVSGVGCVKYGLKETGAVEMENRRIAVTGPTMRSVKLPDLIIDVAADDLKEIDIIGDFFRMPLREIRSSKLFAQADFDELAALADNQGGGRPGNTARRNGMFNANRPRREFRQKLVLVDIAIPSQGIILTCDAEFSLGHPIAERPYYGRGNHPYGLLIYQTVPGEIMPLSPLSNIQDLHVSINVLWNKAVRDAQAAKSNLYAQASAKADAERIIEARHGTTVYGNSPPEMIKELHQRGADPATVMLVMQGEQLFNRRAANPDGLAGLGPQAPTATQEELIQKSASRKVEDMQYTTETFIQDGLEKLLYYCFTDPLINLPLSYRINEGDTDAIVRSLTPEDLRGDFLDYNIKISPHSINRLTPAQKVSAAVRMLELVQPMLPMAEQLGDVFQVREFIESIAELSGVSDIVEDWFIHMSPSRFKNKETVGQPPGKAAFSRRVYERRGVSQGAGQGQQQQMMSQLASMASAGAN